MDFSGDFTIEIKFKRQKLNVREDILTKKDLNYNSPSTNDVALFTLQNNRIDFLLRETQSNQIHLISDFTTDTLNWVHVACVRTGSDVQLFINGNMEDSGEFIEDITSNGPLRIGSNRDEIYHPYAIPMRPFDGGIDEVRFWNIGRSAVEIQNYMNIELVGNEPGLVSYFNFNQGAPCEINTSVYTLMDATASSNTGFLTNFDLTGTTYNPCESNWNEFFLSKNENYINHKIQIFPNPVKDYLTIDFGYENYIHRVNIYNTLGELKTSFLFDTKLTTSQFDLSKFPPGVYLIEISDTTPNQIIYKIIKE